MAEQKNIPTREEFLTWYENCDPTKPAGGDLYVDFSDLHERESERPRHRRGIMRLYEAIDYKSESCQLFSGFSGTGKSTELRQFKKYLEEQGFLVLLVDAEKYLGLSQPLELEDFLVLTAGSFGDAVRQELGENFADLGYWQRFSDFLKTDLHFEEVRTNLGFADMKLSFSDIKPLWMKIRERLSVTPAKLCEERDRFVAECLDRISKSGRETRGTVLIVDNLERVKPTDRSQFPQVMASLSRVLREHSVYLRLANCHVVYSVPPYVHLIMTGLSGRYDGRGFVLPAIRVTEGGLELKPRERGVRAMREILAKRIDLQRTFGGRDDLIEELIVSSGGHVRTLIAFMQDLLSMLGPEGLPVQKEDLEDIFREFRRGVTLLLNDRNVALLDRIARSSSIQGIPDEDHAALAGLMDEYIVLCYRNGDDLFDVHPLIREKVLIRGERMRSGE